MRRLGLPCSAPFRFGRGGELVSRGGFPHQWKARQFPFEVLLIPLPVLRRMQQAVDVMEDVPLGDVRPALRPELCQRPVGDVVAPEFAVEGVGVEGEALGIPRKVKVGETVRRQAMEGFTATDCTEANRLVFLT